MVPPKPDRCTRVSSKLRALSAHSETDPFSAQPYLLLRLLPVEGGSGRKIGRENSTFNSLPGNVFSRENCDPKHCDEQHGEEELSRTSAAQVCGDPPRFRRNVLYSYRQRKQLVSAAQTAQRDPFTLCIACCPS